MTNKESQEFPFNDLYVFVEQGRKDHALDLMYDSIDNLLLRGKFDQCSEILSEVDLGRLDVDSATGFLAITYRARDNITNWGNYLERVQSWLQEKNVEESEMKRLLHGFY